MATRIKTVDSHEVKTESVAEALKQCANRNFVTLDWVQEVPLPSVSSQPTDKRDEVMTKR